MQWSWSVRRDKKSILVFHVPNICLLRYDHTRMDLVRLPWYTLNQFRTLSKLWSSCWVVQLRTWMCRCFVFPQIACSGMRFGLISLNAWCGPSKIVHFWTVTSNASLCIYLFLYENCQKHSCVFRFLNKVWFL